MREFEAAHGLRNTEPNVKYNVKPREIKRLDSIIEHDDLADEAFARLSERSKIFCSKHIRDFTEEIKMMYFEFS